MLRINSHRQPQLFPNISYLIKVLRTANPCNCLTITSLLRNQTCKHIHFIMVRCGNQQIRALNSCLLLGNITCTISMHSHDIILCCHRLKHLCIIINDCHLMALRRKLFRKRTSDPTTTGYNYIHTYLHSKIKAIICYYTKYYLITQSIPYWNVKDSRFHPL